MKINEISKLTEVLNVKQTKKVERVDKESNSDKVELSKEGKALSKASSNLTPERIAEISKRIEEKFYDRDEVLNVVAERLINSTQFQDLIEGNRFDKNL